MSAPIVNIDNKNAINNHLNKSEELVYNHLKNSAKQIKLYKEGKVELRDARELLNEL